MRKVKPAVEAFLAERGLTLSEEKTVITYIKDGFTFLGQTFRKEGGKLHIRPSKAGVFALIRKVGAIIRKYVGAPMPFMIKKLNQAIRGWANYHRHVMSSETFSLVDNYVFEQLKRMLRKRHRNKSKKWLLKKYWTAAKGKNTFAVSAKVKKGVKKVYQVVRTCAIGIRRHIKKRLPILMIQNMVHTSGIEGIGRRANCCRHCQHDSSMRCLHRK